MKILFSYFSETLSVCFLIICYLSNTILASNCSSKITLPFGRSLHLTSLNYPEKDVGEFSCHHIIETLESEYKIQLSCTLFSLPSVRYMFSFFHFPKIQFWYFFHIYHLPLSVFDCLQVLCSDQRLEVFNISKESSNTSRQYCGDRPFAVTSKSNQLNVIYSRFSVASPGSFNCVVTAVWIHVLHVAIDIQRISEKEMKKI